MTFDQWLGNVGALNADGTISLTNVAASINTVNPPTLQWIWGGGSVGDSGVVDPTKYMSFGTPVGGLSVTSDAGGETTKQYCGKAVVTDLHAGGTRANGDLPTSCAAAELSAQEKALEFLFFDLAACVRDETVPQTPPPPK